jgi:group I intron endonuclease
MGCVYLARNKVNGKCYVGKTIHDLADRRKSHERDALGGVPWIFHNALRKYGFDAFEWSVLSEDGDDEWLLLMEQKWIRRLGTKTPNGYNMTDGGEGFVNPCEEVIEKIRVAVTKMWGDPKIKKTRAFVLKDVSLEDLHGPEKASEIRRKQSEAKVGKIQTPESNAKRSDAMTGRRKSPEAIENMKLACANKTEEARTNSLASLAAYNERRSVHGISEHTRKMLKLSHLGNKASEQTRAKMREAQKRRRERERSV